MGRKRRESSLSPIERQFRLAEWVDRNLTVVEKSGPEWVCICPMCGREKLAIHVGRKVYQCLSAACQFRSWHPRYLVAATLNVAPDVADEVMAAFGLGRQLGPVDGLTPTIAPTYRPAHKMPIASLPPVAWNTLRPLQQAYLDRRGIPREHQRRLGLSTILGDHTRSKADRVLTGRIMFPIWSPAGHIVFWVARSPAADTKAKVINMPRPCRETKHGAWCACYHEEWGLPPVPGAAEAHEVVVGSHWIVPGQPVIVVEGPTDVAVCGPQFAGTMGAHLSEAQAMLIAASGASEAIILFDGDKGGREAAPKAAEVLSAYMPARWTTCPDGTDPGILGRDRAYTHALAAPAPGSALALGPLGKKNTPQTRMAPPFAKSLQKK